MELRTDRQAQRRRRDQNVAADRTAEKARGLFLRADEVAGLRYHLDRVERGVVDDWSLRGVVRRVLNKGGEIELRRRTGKRRLIRPISSRTCCVRGVRVRASLSTSATPTTSVARAGTPSCSSPRITDLISG